MASLYLTLIGSSFQIVEIEPKKRKKKRKNKKRTRTNFVSLNSMQICRIHTLHAKRELKARKSNSPLPSKTAVRLLSEENALAIQGHRPK